MIMVYVGVSLVSAVVAKIILDKSFYQLIMREDWSAWPRYKQQRIGS